jgi:hypothetical protein
LPSRSPTLANSRSSGAGHAGPATGHIDSAVILEDDEGSRLSDIVGHFVQKTHYFLRDVSGNR